MFVRVDERRHYKTSGPEVDADFAQMDPEQVATAIAFLRQCRKVKKPNRHSYGLKHAAERWGGSNGRHPYVANGALIAAALYLGFIIKTVPKDLNVFVAVAVKDVRRLDPAASGRRGECFRT
jgi:hypothetical protein